MIRADKIIPPAERLRLQLEAAGLREFVREYRFHKKRKWRFDFLFPTSLLAIEVEGGIWATYGARRCPMCKSTPAGRHLRGKGAEGDLEKYAEAMLLGYRVLRVSPKMIDSGIAIETIITALKKGDLQ